MGDIKKLEIWELSMKLTTIIYKITSEGKLAKDFTLKDQLRRAAVSVPSNIAEGAASGFDKMGVRYFFIARGSLAELQTQITVAYRIEFLNQENYLEILERIELILKKLNKLITYRKEYIKS